MIPDNSPPPDWPVPPAEAAEVTFVPWKSCGCGVLDGEECDCESFAASVEYAPRIWWQVTR